MDLVSLSESIPLLAYAFCTIPIETHLRLENSLNLLKSTQELEKLFFFGRIDGRYANYFVAFGTAGRDLFQQRKLFYSRNEIEWFLLLEPSYWSADWGQMIERFTGDPAYIFEAPPTCGSTSTYAIIEQDRLWFVVTSILREAACVPRGALYLTDEREIIINPYFKPLQAADTEKLASYHHFRLPENAAEENLRGRMECNLSIDIFDTLEDVIPWGKSFAYVQDEMKHVVLVKSLHWLGLVNYHKLDSTRFGFCYMGDGRKNWTLLFMT